MNPVTTSHHLGINIGASSISIVELQKSEGQLKIISHKRSLTMETLSWCRQNRQTQGNFSGKPGHQQNTAKFNKIPVFTGMATSIWMLCYKNG